MEAVKEKKLQWDVIAMYAVAMGIFIWSDLSVLLGPVLFLLMALCVTQNKILPCIALVFIGNDALGTVAFGRGSFDLILCILLFIRMFWIRKTRYNKKSVFFLLGSLLLCVYMSFFDHDLATSLIFATLFNCFFAFVVYEECADNEEKLAEFFRYLGFACLLIAVVMVFIGGTETLEIVHDGNERIETVRIGVLGAGTGDPNFSGLRLLFGAVCIFYAKEFGKWRWAMLPFFVISMVKTLSITLLLIALLLIVFGVLIRKGLSRRIKGILILLLVVFIVIYAFVIIPSDQLPESVDMMRLRVIEKVESLISGNINDVTTNRTNMSDTGLDNFAEGNILQQLFGFNSIFCHNTYIDTLNRFGIIGFCWFLYTIIRNLYRAMKNRDTMNGKRIVMLKVLYIAFAFTLSIHSGVEAAFLMLFLLVM